MRLAVAFALVGAVMPLCACCRAVVPREECVLENASVRLLLKDSSIASLFDKIRSIERASPLASSTAGMFGIQLVIGNQPTLDLEATQMVSHVARQTANGADREFIQAEATVRLQVSLSPSAGEILWSISATPSDKSLCVGSVACRVVQTEASENGKIKNAMLPFYEGRLHPLNFPITRLFR